MKTVHIISLFCLLALGGVFLNGCQSPITNTNTITLPSTGTNGGAIVYTNLPPLPPIIYDPLVAELKKYTDEIQEIKAFEKLLIVIVIVICGVNIMIYLQVRRPKEKDEKQSQIDPQEIKNIEKSFEDLKKHDKEFNVGISESPKSSEQHKSPDGSNPASQTENALEQYQKEMYAALIATRHYLDKLTFKTSERYDQWVLTLSGGALAISLTFIEKIAPEPVQYSWILLGLSWLAYIVAVLAGFLAIFYSRKAIHRAIQIGDDNYRHFIATSTEDKPEGDPPPDLKNHSSTIVGCLNNITIACLITGTALMCVFALVNLGGAKNLKDTYNSKEITVNVNLSQVTNSTANINKGKP